MVAKVDAEEGVSTGLDLRPVIRTSTQMTPGRGVQERMDVLTSEREEAVKNNEQMEVQREQRGS